MKTYRSSRLVIEVPESWVDASTYVLAGPAAAGFSPNVVCTDVSRAVGTGLSAYVDAQLKEMTALPEFELLARHDPEDRRGVALVFQWKDPKQGLLRQRQHYVVSSGATWVVTATMKAEIFDAFDPLFQVILKSARGQDWTEASHG